MQVTPTFTPTPTRISVDLSVEYCHVYTGETPDGELSGEHLRSIAVMRETLLPPEADGEANECPQVAPRTQKVVMVDDYSPGNTPDFDYDALRRNLVFVGETRTAIVPESSLVPRNLEVIELLRRGSGKPAEADRLVRYIERSDGKHPCSLFIASWYLVRLGILAPPDSARYIRPADNLLNILPERFRDVEDKARRLIAAVGGGSGAGEYLLSRIRNIYF